MSNVVLKDIEVAAEKLLSFVAKAKKVVAIAPAVIAALGTILGAVGKALTDLTGAAASSGLNLALDEEEISDLKDVWEDVEAFGKDIGLKL